jgi:hypothetical protein
MANDRMASLREKVSQIRGLEGVKMVDVKSQGIERGRAQEQPDPVRERYRHLLEKKQADLTPHPSAGYGRKPEAAPTPQKGGPTPPGAGPSPSAPQQQISPEVKRTAAEHMKEVTKVQQKTKVAEGQQRSQPAQQPQRGGRQR